MLRSVYEPSKDANASSNKSQVHEKQEITEEMTSSEDFPMNKKTESESFDISASTNTRNKALEDESLGKDKIPTESSATSMSDLKRSEEAYVVAEDQPLSKEGGSEAPENVKPPEHQGVIEPNVVQSVAQESRSRVCVPEECLAEKFSNEGSSSVKVLVEVEESQSTNSVSDIKVIRTVGTPSNDLRIPEKASVEAEQNTEKKSFSNETKDTHIVDERSSEKEIKNGIEEAFKSSGQNENAKGNKKEHDVLNNDSSNVEKGSDDVKMSFAKSEKASENTKPLIVREIQPDTLAKVIHKTTRTELDSRGSCVAEVETKMNEYKNLTEESVKTTPNVAGDVKGDDSGSNEKSATESKAGAGAKDPNVSTATKPNVTETTNGDSEEMKGKTITKRDVVVEDSEVCNGASANIVAKPDDGSAYKEESKAEEGRLGMEKSIENDIARSESVSAIRPVSVSDESSENATLHELGAESSDQSLGSDTITGDSLSEVAESGPDGVGKEFLAGSRRIEDVPTENEASEAGGRSASSPEPDEDQGGVYLNEFEMTIAHMERLKGREPVLDVIFSLIQIICSFANSAMTKMLCNICFMYGSVWLLLYGRSQWDACSSRPGLPHSLGILGFIGLLPTLARMASVVFNLPAKGKSMRRYLRCLSFHLDVIHLFVFFLVLFCRFLPEKREDFKGYRQDYMCDPEFLQNADMSIMMWAGFVALPLFMMRDITYNLRHTFRVD